MPMNQMQVLDAFAWSWLALAGLCTIYVAVDQFRGNPESAVMKWGWILITLYMGPIGLLLYVLADKEPAPGTHEEFIKPLWKQGIGSTVHCIAGDATGIILAAAITATLGLPMWQDLIVEYIAGFAFGLFIFQSLFMKNMMGGSYLKALRNSFVPEWLSMNMMMAGMAPVMVLLMMGRDMRAMQPAEPLFWLVMSIGVVVGFATAYPVNVWMVARRLKHGLMTVRPGQSAVTDHHQHDEPSRPDVHDHPGTTAPALPVVTRPQLAAVAMITVLALVVTPLWAASRVNTTLSAHDVGGAVMPPGMVMTRDTPGEAMKDMAAVDPRQVSYDAPADARGAQLLDPRIEGGVKVYELETSIIRWPILNGQTMDAYAINRQVPGPTLRFDQGDRVRIRLTNRLPESTTLHWHGLILPNAMDGPAEITQPPVAPGANYTYEFTAGQSGTYFYHSHDHPDRQQGLGMYGALIIDPATPTAIPPYDMEYTVELQEWLEREGLTYPAMPMEGALPNFFTINGKAYPETDTVRMRVGQRLLVRFIGTSNSFIHPMHIHGGPFTVVAVDGNPLRDTARFDADTVNLGPGQRYDVIWTAREPGKWLLHCHIPHHTTNDNVETDGAGGLTMVLDVE
jgi:FtsP/CotA-like multicopper oxidase with cupredoxin domain